MRPPIPDPGALGARVRAALERPSGTPLAAAIAASALTIVAVDGAAGAAAAPALGALLEAFARAGKPARRVVVLVAGGAAGAPPRAAVARLAAACPGVARVLAHDPGTPHRFVAGVTSRGVPVALDEALLEAEALVTVGPARRVPGGVSAGAEVLFPGLASRAARAAHFALAPPARAAHAREAAGLFPPDFRVCWAVEPGGALVAWAGAGDEVERAAFASLDPSRHAG